MAVKGYHVGLVGRQAVVYEHLAAACLVKDGHLDTVAEGAFALGYDGADIGDQGAVGDIVIGDVAMHAGDAAVVADRDVMQRCAVDAGVALEASGEGESILKAAQAHRPAESGVAHESGIEAFAHLYL